MEMQKPSISSSLWRSVIDDAKRCYFDSVINPSVIWVDLGKVDLEAGAKLMVLQFGVPGEMNGDVSSKFAPAQPFKFLAP